MISARFNLIRAINFYRVSFDIDKFYCNSELFFCEEIVYHKYVFKILRMFVKSRQNALNTAHNPLKVRPCFIRLLRDKELDKHIRKRYKKNETEVNKKISFIHVFLIIVPRLLKSLSKIGKELARVLLP